MIEYEKTLPGHDVMLRSDLRSHVSSLIITPRQCVGVGTLSMVRVRWILECYLQIETFRSQDIWTGVVRPGVTTGAEAGGRINEM